MAVFTVTVAPGFVILLDEIAMMRRADRLKIVLKGGYVFYLDSTVRFDEVHSEWLHWIATGERK